MKCLFVVFGATGDLNRRKLLPALYHLARRGFLENTQILGVARSPEMNDRSFRAIAREVISNIDGQGTETIGQWCDNCVHYRSIGSGGDDEFRTLAAEIERLEKQHGLPGNHVFYLATPPQSFAPTIQGIGAAGLNRGSGWTRIVAEKPFGRDSQSAAELNALIHQFFDESQIYRIDHYLGKETVQNLLIFRFANPIFEFLWNRDRIDNVQITVAEQLGVEKRAEYYEQTGAMRDMVQNHLTQVLSLIAMEVPAILEPEAIRDEKAKVLHSIAPIKPDDVVFGQYAAGYIEGHDVSGYRGEPGVANDSKMETFVVMKLSVANWRWHGVPFYIRTGKRLPRQVSKIVITFRCAPVSVFRPFGPGCDVRSNVLTIKIQPDEGFNLQFQVKTPGQPVVLATQDLRFRYSEVFSSIPEGYETLLQDILTGDQSLFVRADWVESSWRLYDALLKNPPELHAYPAGTWGPAEADRLLARKTHTWFPV